MMLFRSYSGVILQLCCRAILHFVWKMYVILQLLCFLSCAAILYVLCGCSRIILLWFCNCWHHPAAIPDSFLLFHFGFHMELFCSVSSVHSFLCHMRVSEFHCAFVRAVMKAVTLIERQLITATVAWLGLESFASIWKLNYCFVAK